MDHDAVRLVDQSGCAALSHVSLRRVALWHNNIYLGPVTDLHRLMSMLVYVEIQCTTYNQWLSLAPQLIPNSPLCCTSYGLHPSLDLSSHSIKLDITSAHHGLLPHCFFLALLSMPEVCCEALQKGLMPVVALQMHTPHEPPPATGLPPLSA